MGNCIESIMLGIDVGYSSVKVADSEEKVWTFHSHVQKTDKFAAAVENNDVVIEIEGEAFVVGGNPYDQALTIDTEMHGSKNWLYLVCRALFEKFKNAPDKENLFVERLAFGLPIAARTKEKADELESHKTFEFAVVENPFGSLPRKTSYKVTVGDVHVFMQGLSMFYLLEDEIQEGESLALLDIGHHTLDLALVMGGELVRKKCFSTPHGIKEVYDHVGRAWKHKTQKDIGAFHIRKILENRGQKYKAKWVSMADKIDYIMDAYLPKIQNEIQAVWEGDIYLVDRVVLGGGGAVVLKDYFAKAFPEITEEMIEVIPSPVFGNALGYVRAAKYSAA